MERSVREEARLRAGEILPPDRLAAAPAGSSAQRDMQGWVCAHSMKETTGTSARARYTSAMQSRPVRSSSTRGAAHLPCATADNALARLHGCGAESVVAGWFSRKRHDLPSLIGSALAGRLRIQTPAGSGRDDVVPA